MTPSGPALKPTGTVWLNLGDCYAGSGKVQRTRQRSAESIAKAGVTRQGSHIGAGDVPCPEGLKPKDLMMVPARVALALQEAGWWLRSEIVWAKAGGGMPESVRDRPSQSHEKIFLLAKQGQGYHYDQDACAQPAADTLEVALKKVSASGKARGVNEHIEGAGRNDADIFGRERERLANIAASTVPRGHDSKTGFSGRWGAKVNGTPPGTQMMRRLRNYEPAPVPVWEIRSAMYPGAHFATFPPELVERCLQAGCPEGGVVLDPFGGAGTTALVALHTGRTAVLCELSEEYADLARRRVESGGRLDSEMRSERREQRKRAEAEEHGQGRLL